MKSKLSTRGLVAALWVVLMGWAPLTFGAAPIEKAVQPQVVEPWKGPPAPRNFTLGVLTGMGIRDGSTGFSLMGNAGFKIAHEGFLPDVNDQAFIETEMGALWVSAGSAFTYSLHLRWDFERDATWTFFAMGGLGGTITGQALGSSWRLAPRFGAGAFWRLDPKFHVRFEIAADVIGTGINVEF